MSLVVFFILAALAAVAIAYPLLPAHRPAQPEAHIGDVEVEAAVQRLREARKRGDLAVSPADGVCPACSAPYQAGDRFCVRCGQTLPQQETAPPPAQKQVCPSCGAALREDDLFCARCGRGVQASNGVESRKGVQP